VSVDDGRVGRNTSYRHGVIAMHRFTTAALLAAARRTEVVLGEARVTILAGADETSGVAGMVDYRMPPGYIGPPAHVHPTFDEIFFLREGTLTFRLGDDQATAESGDTVVVPGAVPHTFANLSGASARVMIMIAPGGFESYFQEVAPLVAGGPPDREAIQKLSEQYGVTTVGPPLG
jgi:mannose-6-phosphate isomerase-like protein (cupin superfamily)